MHHHNTQLTSISGMFTNLFTRDIPCKISFSHLTRSLFFKNLECLLVLQSTSELDRLSIKMIQGR